jgi:hypothetical protein
MRDAQRFDLLWMQTALDEHTRKLLVLLIAGESDSQVA